MVSDIHTEYIQSTFFSGNPLKTDVTSSVQLLRIYF